MRLNRKGQTLVLFLLLLPILLLVMAYLVDLGFLHLQKRRIDTTIQNALQYGKQHIDSATLEQDLENLLLLNLDPIDYQIQLEEQRLILTVSKKIDPLFPFLFSEKQTKITVVKSIKMKE